MHILSVKSYKEVGEGGTGRGEGGEDLGFMLAATNRMRMLLAIDE